MTPRFQRPVRREPPATPRYLRPHNPAPTASESWNRPWVQLRTFSFHPCLYPAMLNAASPDAKPGDLVHIYDKEGRPFGAGFYNPKARVPLRVLCHGPEPFGEEHVTRLLERAVDLRLTWLQGGKDTDAWRVVNSDGDGLSGLTVDRYADVLSVEVHSLGVHQRLDRWLPLLHARLGTRRAIVEVDDRIARIEGIAKSAICNPQSAIRRSNVQRSTPNAQLPTPDAERQSLIPDLATSYPNPELRTPNSELRTPISHLRTPIPQLRSPISELRTPNFDLPSPISEPQSRNFELRSPNFELRSPISDLRPLRTVHIREHGVRYEVDFRTGHKTGFFCDQRENRLKLARWVAGGRLLDLCCYTGGFAVTAAALGQPSEVTGVDLDENAIALARRNGNLNQLNRIQWVHADAFSWARQMQQNGERWQTVVLDPPRLVGGGEDDRDGWRKYEDLNGLAMQLVEPGGLLVTCSCSGPVSLEDFETVVIRTAHRLNKRLQFLDRTGAGPDHPVLSNCLESRYLKVLWVRVW